MRFVRVYNSLTRKVEKLLPGEDGRVKIYVCGVTVYDHSHLGHARTIVLFDVLRRYLVYKGYNILFVENFTDIDDKIINKAKERGISTSELTQYFIDQYFSDFDSLNVLRADVHPKATDHIKEIQEFISRLMEKDYAYVTSTGVYFEVSKFAGYGKLSGKNISELKAGARVEIDSTKRTPLDFAVWKFAEDEPNWKSPWGKGRPGWHIECSVMSMKYLGETFEIHGGGHDLIFPHHENEIAQSEARTGKPFASKWMHAGLLNISKEKMSKSIGNIIPVHEALRQWGPNIIRLYSLSSHYRGPINYSEEAMQNAQENWRLIENAFAEIQSTVHEDSSQLEEARKTVKKEFKAMEKALDEDFNTPASLGALMRLVRFINRAASTGKLSKQASEVFEKSLATATEIYGFKLGEVSLNERQEVEHFVQRRNTLRSEKKFREADEIRETLKLKGFELTDHPTRTVWRKAVGKLS